MPTLIIMRHGQAQNLVASDEQRPLTATGHIQVAAQAAKQTIPWHTLQRVCVSPYVRTQQTYAHLQLALTPSALQQSALQQPALQQSALQQPAHNLVCTNNWHLETSQLLTPYGQPVTVQEWLLQAPLLDTLLITHQPLISQLVGFFDHGDRDAGPPMLPASIAVLKGEVFARGCMHTQGIFHA